MLELGTTRQSRRTARLVVVQFVLLAVAWGASFLFIKVGLDGLSPAQVVLGRLLAGAGTLALVSVATRTPLPPPGPVWLHLGVVAALMCVAPFLLFSWAEQYVSSGLASIDNATTPLMAGTVALIALPAERPTRARLLGLLTGFAGVVVVLGPWRGLAAGGGLAQGGCLLATACYGVAFVYLRRFVAPRRLPAVSVATVQVGLAALLMLALTPALGRSAIHLTAAVVASVGALGVIGTGLAYVFNTNVVTAWGATNASTVTYLTPVVGVALGVLALSESPTWNQPVGAVLVVLGIAVSQQTLRRPGRSHP